MPLFRCSTCGCVENTALGHYWTVAYDGCWPDDDATAKKPQCSEHGPKFFKDGTRTEYGAWHGKFPKRSAVGMLVDQSGHLWSSDESLPKHYRIVGKIGEDGTVVPTSTSRHSR